MWDFIDDLIGSDDDFLRETASKLNEFKTAYDNGDLSRDEFYELSDDLLALERINEHAESLEHRIFIADMVNKMIVVIKAVV